MCWYTFKLNGCKYFNTIALKNSMSQHNPNL